jgi:hypothetical protein
MLKPIREPLQEDLTLGFRIGSAGEMTSAGDRKFADLARARQARGEVRRCGSERAGQLRVFGHLNAAVPCGHGP